MPLNLSSSLETVQRRSFLQLEREIFHFNNNKQKKAKAKQSVN